jgi:hypothetical protein
MQNPKAREIARCSEERSRALERRVAHLRQARISLAVGAACVCAGQRASFRHSNDR